MIDLVNPAAGLFTLPEDGAALAGAGGCAMPPRIAQKRRRGQEAKPEKTGLLEPTSAPGGGEKRGTHGAPKSTGKKRNEPTGAGASVTTERVEAEGSLAKPLTEFEKGMACALVAVGLSHRQTAVLIGCHRCAIDRLFQRDETLRGQYPRLAAKAGLIPLVHLMQASRTSWRAAVWLVNHFEKRMPNQEEAVFQLGAVGHLVEDTLRISTEDQNERAAQQALARIRGRGAH